MTASTIIGTLTSLPPEMQLKILGYLPRPTLDERLTESSPLICTALVSSKLRPPLQEPLFKKVAVKD